MPETSGLCSELGMVFVMEREALSILSGESNTREGFNYLSSVQSSQPAVQLQELMNSVVPVQSITARRATGMEHVLTPRERGLCWRIKGVLSKIQNGLAPENKGLPLSGLEQ